MANEVQHDDRPDESNVFFCVFKNDSGTWKVNNTGGNTWEAWNDTDADNDDYSVALSDSGGGQYVDDFPATITDSGWYKVVVYQGATPSTARPIGKGWINWSGTAEIYEADASKLRAYIQVLARSDDAIKTDNATELAEINADEDSGAGDYNLTRDSQEGIRDGFLTDETVRTALGLNTNNLTNLLAAIQTTADAVETKVGYNFQLLTTVADNNPDSVNPQENTTTLLLTAGVGASGFYIGSSVSIVSTLGGKLTRKITGYTGVAGSYKLTIDSAFGVPFDDLDVVIIWTDSKTTNSIYDVVKAGGTGDLATMQSNVSDILADTGTDGVKLAADQEVNVTKINGTSVDGPQDLKGFGGFKQGG